MNDKSLSDEDLRVIKEYIEILIEIDGQLK